LWPKGPGRCPGSWRVAQIEALDAESATVYGACLHQRGVESVTPPGAVTVAVLVSAPDAEADMVQLAAYVELPPEGRFTRSLMLQLPEAVHVPPPAPEQVQVQVSDAGNVLATVVPVALLGPALLAVIV